MTKYNNLDVQDGKKSVLTLRALRMRVEKDGKQNKLFAEPVAHNKGDRIEPATPVNEDFPTFDVPVVNYNVNDTERLVKLGMSQQVANIHQKAIDVRYFTNRGASEARKREAAKQQGPSIGE